MHIEKAIEFCDEIVDEIDTNIDDISEVGVAFFEDVRAKVVSMQETLEGMQARGKVEATDPQARALRNWDDGIGAWIQ